MRYSESRVPTGRKLLRINLDETSVSMAPDMRTGLVVTQLASSFRSKVPQQDTRTHVTYVAVVCDDTSLQQHMLHIVIGSKPKLNNHCFDKMNRLCPQGVHVIRNELKAWNNTYLMVKILGLIKKALSHRPDIQPLLLLDVAQCHIQSAVMSKAKELGIWLVFIPAQVTFLLQPLDTHGFAGFKSWLKAQFAELLGQSPDGVVCRLQWLLVLQTAKRDYFDLKSWAESFHTTGARRPCVRFTKALQKYAQPSLARDAPAQEPTAESLALVWPRRRRMLYAHAALFKDPVPRQPVEDLAVCNAAKRSLSEVDVSIALSSRSLKRACRQYPSRSVA